MHRAKDTSMAGERGQNIGTTADSSDVYARHTPTLWRGAATAHTRITYNGTGGAICGSLSHGIELALGSLMSINQMLR